MRFLCINVALPYCSYFISLGAAWSLFIEVQGTDASWRNLDVWSASFSVTVSVFRTRCRQACPDDVAPALGAQLARMGGACRRLSERLLAALDAALGGGRPLTGCHRRQLRPGGWSVLRLLHYPAVPSGTRRGTHTRCGTHTDFSTLTLLFQHGVGGLEVRTDAKKAVNRGIEAYFRIMMGTNF